MIVCLNVARWACDLDMYVFFYMVSMTITLKYVNVDIMCTIYCLTHSIIAIYFKSTMHSIIFCLIYY